MPPTKHKTKGGKFSVQYGWSLLTTRVRPGLFNDRQGVERIRRLLLDLARGAPELAVGLDDSDRYDLTESNRLDPYQVGTSILSAYANSPLHTFRQFGSKYKDISLADCIHAAAVECNLFKHSAGRKRVKEESESCSKCDNIIYCPKCRNEISKEHRAFMELMLRFLSHIRDNDNTTEDCKDLSNRLLSFCSISRHSPRELENDEKKLRKIIDQYLVQKGRLIHVSLRDVHKAAKKLRLDQNLIWGWSIIITVCFEKTVDEAYRNFWGEVLVTYENTRTCIVF